MSFGKNTQRCIMSAFVCISIALVFILSGLLCLSVVICGARSRDEAEDIEQEARDLQRRQ